MAQQRNPGLARRDCPHCASFHALRFSQRSRCAPLPLVGRGWGWGSSCEATLVRHLHHPPPYPPPQGGREHTEFAAQVSGNSGWLCSASKRPATRPRRRWSNRSAEGPGRILSNIVLSQIDEHAAFGGVVPEIAARAHVEALDLIVAKAMADAGKSFADLDAVAVAAGPGLIGGVIVGLTTAKAIAL